MYTPVFIRLFAISLAVFFLGCASSTLTGSTDSLTHDLRTEKDGPPIPSTSSVPKNVATIPAKETRILQSRPDRLLVQLPNGLIVLAQENHAAPVISAQVWVKTGSIYEQEHVGAGLSHFLEHLLSGGSTSTRSEAASNAILGQIGATTNAATSLDTVRYYINTTSAHTAQAVDLLSDWMLHSLITPEEYEREQSVIQREFEMGQGEPGRIFWKLTQQARYTAHPARHPTIGYLDEFLTITRDEIYDFYKRMYVPNNMVFIVVGDIDKQLVVEQIRSLWQDAQPGSLPQLSFPVEPPVDSPREAVGIATVDQPQLRLAWSGTRLGGPHDYAMDLLGAILGQGESSRLIQTVRDDQRLVNTIDAYNLSFAWAEGFFGIDAVVAIPPKSENSDQDDITSDAWLDRHVNEAKEAILDQVEQICQSGVTSQELARAKRKTLAAAAMTSQSAQGWASRLASDLISMNDPDYLQHYVEAIEAISAQDIQVAAKQILVPQQLITIRLDPAPPGQSPKPLQRLNDVVDATQLDREPVTLDNADLLARYEAKNKGDASIDHTAVTVEPIKRFELPNGLRLIVGRSNLVPAVAIQYYQLGGLLADTPGQEGIAHAMSVMTLKGTTTRTAQQIAQQIEDLGASLSTQCGNNTHYITAECLEEDWPTVLELLADVTLNPTFPQDEWQKLQPRILAAIDRQTDAWIGELGQHFRQAYFGLDHPWSQTPLGRREVIETLTIDDLQRFHRRHLGARQAVLAVFGDVDPQAIKEKVEQLFSDLPQEPPTPWQPQATTPPQERTIEVSTAKSLAAVQIGFGPGTARVSEDFPSIQVLASVLSSFPTGRLEQALRGDGPGLVYAVWAGQFTGLVPGYFAVVYNTQPTTIDESLDRTMAVIQRVRDEEVDSTTLTRAKAKVLANMFLRKQSNSERAADAALNELYGLGLDEPQHFRQTVEGLDAPTLRQIARTYLQDPVTVILAHTNSLEESGTTSSSSASQQQSSVSTEHVTKP